MNLVIVPVHLPVGHSQVNQSAELLSSSPWQRAGNSVKYILKILLAMSAELKSIKAMGTNNDIEIEHGFLPTSLPFELLICEMCI